MSSQPLHTRVHDRVETAFTINGIRILVVDGNAFARAGLLSILRKEPWINEIGEASTGALALTRIAQESWHAVVVELKLPDVNGLELLRAVTTDYPRMPVLVLSGMPDAIYADAAMKQGAAAFISKSMGVEEIVKAVYLLAEQGKVVGKRPLAKRLAVGDIAAGNRVPRSRLSLREVQTFMGLAVGRSSGDIARSLDVSIKTICSHRARIFRKMRMTSNADIVLYAIRNELIG